MVLKALLPHQVMEAATRNSHKQVVKLLLGGYGNALHAASISGHEQVVKLLLDKGDDVSVQGLGLLSLKP
jgi:hypothetical protein